MSENIPSIRQIIGALRPGQLWAIGGAVATVVLGSFGLGAFVELTRSETDLLGKDREIATLQRGVSDFENALKVARAELQRAADRHQMAESKNEFLNRYVAFLLVGDELTKKLFADFVCVMWRESQERKLHLDRGRIRISLEDLTTRITPEVQRLLEEHGIDRQTLNQLHVLSVEERRLGTPRDGAPDVSKAASSERAQIRRDLSRLEKNIAPKLNKVVVTKTVRFFDGTTYDVPAPVAIIVHDRNDCVPR